MIGGDVPTALAGQTSRPFSFRVPRDAAAGLAAHPMPGLTIAAEVQWVAYGDIFDRPLPVVSYAGLVGPFRVSRQGRARRRCARAGRLDPAHRPRVRRRARRARASRSASAITASPRTASRRGSPRETATGRPFPITDPPYSASVAAVFDGGRADDRFTGGLGVTFARSLSSGLRLRRRAARRGSSRRASSTGSRLLRNRRAPRRGSPSRSGPAPRPGSRRRGAAAARGSRSSTAGFSPRRWKEIPAEAVAPTLPAAAARIRSTAMRVDASSVSRRRIARTSRDQRAATSMPRIARASAWPNAATTSSAAGPPLLSVLEGVDLDEHERERAARALRAEDLLAGAREESPAIREVGQGVRRRAREHATLLVGRGRGGGAP